MNLISKIHKYKFYIYGSLFKMLLLCILILPVIHVYTLHSNVADLGYFVSNIVRVKDEWQIAFYGHIQPLLLLNRFFAIKNHTYLSYGLVILQSLVIIYTVLLIRKYYGFLTSFVLLLYPPIWTISLFDFHLDTFVLPILAWYFILLERSKYIYASLVSSLLVFIKEPFAFEAVGCGLLILIKIFYSNSKNKIYEYAAAIIILLSSFIYGWYSIEVLIPKFQENSGTFGIYSPAFNWLGSNLFHIFQNIFTGYEYIFEIFDLSKIKYLLLLFLPLLFIPIISPSIVMVSFPLIAISLLSKNSNYYNYGNHYTAGLIIPLVIAFHYGFIKIDKLVIVQYKNTLKIAILTLVFIIHFLLSYSPVSRIFLSNKTWAYSYSSYFLSPRDVIIKESIRSLVGDNKLISLQNNLYIPDLFNYGIIRDFPAGVREKYNIQTWIDGDSKIKIVSKKADYVILDSKRTLFIYAEGCNYVYKKCINEKIQHEYYDYIDYLNKNYNLIYDFDGYYIYEIR